MSSSRHNYNHFVNRRGEIEEVERLLADNECRLLFIRGPRGIGKSGLLHFLIRTFRDQPMVQAFLDFEGRSPIGKRREALIYQLSSQLRGPFANLLEELDQGMPGAPGDSKRDRHPVDGGPRFDGGQIAEAISENVVRSMASAGPTRHPAGIAINTGGGAYIKGNVQTQRFVGRDDVDVTVAIDTIVIESPPDPGGGTAKAAERWERRTNRLFSDALHDLLATNRVVLYFDHCEKSKPSIREWLSDELLNQFDQPLQDTSRLRIVLVGGEEVPWEEFASKPDPILSDLELKGLELKYVEEFWVEKLGLDPGDVADVMQACGGVPVLMLQEVEDRRKPSGHG